LFRNGAGAWSFGALKSKPDQRRIQKTGRQVSASHQFSAIAA